MIKNVFSLFVKSIREASDSVMERSKPTTSTTRKLRNTAMLCLVCTMVYFALYRSTNRRKFDRSLPKPVSVKQETLVCQDLIETAKRILDGEPIPMPFSGRSKTLWKFKQSAPKEFIKNHFVFGQNSNESAAEILKKRQYYNVSVSEIKARKLLITFGDKCCVFSKRRAVSKAKTVGGFDDARWYNLTVMPPKFLRTHNDVLKARRGAGYWLWKSYILLKNLIEHMNEGDIVMYQDAGAYFIRSAGPLLKLCEHSKDGIIVFSLPNLEHDFTKQDAFIRMNMSFPEAADTPQRLGGFVVLRKCCASIQFVMEWLAYLSDIRIASDTPNTLGIPNPKSFVGHRYDQSVLSLLSKKWGLVAFRDPSQYGRGFTVSGKYSSGLYEQIIMLDRNRN